MTLQTTGPISLANLETEFGDTNPTSLNEYYKGGALVFTTDTAPSVPAAGTISLSNFYGAQATPGGTLQVLTLATTTATQNVAWSSTINNRTTGSTITATNTTNSQALTVTGSTVSGTFTTTGTKTITLVESIARGIGSPKTSTSTVTVASAVVLQTLTLGASTATAGVAWATAINNRTSGSTITATNTTDNQTLTVSGSILNATFSSAGTKTITLVETLSGATGSPKTSTATVTVSAAAPSNFVTNGTFPDLTGWSFTSYNPNTGVTSTDSGIASMHNGMLRLTCLDEGTRTYPAATATLSGLTIGRTYNLSCDYVSNATDGASFYISDNLLNSGGQFSSGTYRATFVADATTLYLTLQANAHIYGESCDFDNVSVT